MGRITFLPSGVQATLEPMAADPNLACDAGSVLQRALAAGVRLDHSCGGMAACATCHCWVTAGGASLAPPRPDELAMLERAIGRRRESRLACQLVPAEEAELVIEIPPEPQD